MDFKYLLVLCGLLALKLHASESALNCGYEEQSIATQCRLAGRMLVEAQSFGEADYLIPYSFSCGPENPGADVQIGISYGLSGDFRKFQIGKTAILSVTSSTAVNLVDLAPAITYSVIFDSGCKLEVYADRIEISPSINTLGQWQQEAITSAKDITGALKLWQQSKNFDKVITWDSDQLKATQKNLEEQIADSLIGSTLTYQDLLYPLDYPDPKLRGRIKDAKDMPAEWQTAVLTDSSLPDKVALLSQVNATLEGRPPVYDATSTASCRKELDQDMDKANKILARADKWKNYLTDQQKATYRALLAKKTAAETAK